jgi:tetratricopeptide (TPR) repeat protein
MSFSLPRFGEGPGERSTPLWLEGRCLELGMTASYSLFVDLFHDTFAWRPEEAEPERVARLITSIQEFVARGDLSAERADEIGPLLGNLLSLRFGNDWDLRLKNTDPEHLKHQTLLAVRDFFVALAKQQPVLLVLEDLHWADSLSLDVISLLMEALAEAPLLLLCVYRPEREQKSVRLGSIASRKCPERYTELLLRELTPSQSRHLVASLLTIEELPSSVRELILEKAHGNPFFLEEVVHSLIDAGLVYREGEVWRAREEIASVTVPESVQSVIRSRVDRLGPELKRVLQTASVMGRLFRRRVLEHTVQTASSGAGGGLAPEALERALWELEERALIYQERMVREEEYSFKHVLTQETVYQSILRRHRAVLHQQVGDAIEALYPERLEEHAERLAYHYERSGADEKAIEYLLKAGEKARRAFLNEAALGYFRRALARLDAAPETSARPAWRQETAALLHEGLGDVQHLLGQYDEARAAFQDALAHLPEQERLRRARLERKIGDTWLPQLRCEEALRACDRAEAALGPAPAGADAEWWQAWADLQMDRFSALYRLRQTEALLALAEQIRPVVEQYGTPAQRGNFLIRLGIVSQQRDRYVISDETLAYARAALAAMEETRDLRQIAEARFVVGSYLLFRGELEEAEAQLQAALGLAERTGDLWSRVIHLTYLTVLYRRRGQLKEVREYAERSLAAATAAQSAMYVGMAKANLAWLAWRSGNPSEAQEYGRAALELWPARGHFLEGLALWPLMGVALGREQMAEAVEYGRALLAPTQQALPDPIRAQVEAALEAQEQGQPERARAHLCQAMARARDMGYA